MEQLQYQMPTTDEQLETMTRSTRGASKHRRDQINTEIQRLRDLLPLNNCVKDRLFQLQVMAMACIYLRKQSYLPHIIQTCEKPIYPLPYSLSTPKEFDAYKAMRGFLLTTTKDGKMLQISDNASEYLGYSVEEIMCQGDSIFDLIDVRDHPLLQQQLADGPASVFDNTFPRDCSFVCRMNLSKTVKRQLNCYKFIMLEGRFIHPSEYYKTLNLMTEVSDHIDPVFAAHCTPLICPKNAETLVRGNTQIFQCKHQMDLRFFEADSIACHHLGFTNDQLFAKSLYDLLHPEQLETLAEMHRTLLREKDGSVMGLIRVQTRYNEWIWLHSVLTIKPCTTDGQLQISGIYQQFSDEQAASLLNSPWIYATRHYSNFKGDLQKDTDFMTASSPESQTNIQRLPERNRKLPREMEQICVNVHQNQRLFDPDPNNNCDDNNNRNEKSLLDSPDSNEILSAAAKSICFEQLQQLCASEHFTNTLPDLGRQDLEDFFRQVEQSTPNSLKNDYECFVKTEPNFELTKGIKREYEEPSSCWIPVNSSWHDPNLQPLSTTQLPPVSTLGSLFYEDSMPEPSQFTKRHRSSIQFVPKQPDTYTVDWPEYCYQQDYSRTQKRHGSWTGIQTG